MCQNSRRLAKHFCLIITGIFSVLSANTQESRQKMGNHQLEGFSQIVSPKPQINFTTDNPKINEIKNYLESKKESFNFNQINPAKIKLNEKLRLDLIEADKLKKDGLSAGGVSDGGGNAVGSQLFDFYENEGSFHFQPEQIVLWNSEILKLIQKANKFIPKISTSGRSLGEDILSAIKSKKWILESKEMTSTSCRNESLVQTLNQIIVGCQNMFEVRLNAQWLLLKADEKNQAGLIWHEAILSWLRDLEKNSDYIKENLEFKVRELNRLFHADLSEEDFQAEFSRLFPQYTVLTQKEVDFENQLPTLAAKIKMNFCQQKKTDDYSTVLNLIKNQPKQYNVIKDHFELYLTIIRLTSRYNTINKVSGSISNLESIPEYKSKVDLYCNEHNENLNYLDKIPLNLEILSNKCKKNIEETFDNYIQLNGISAADVINKESSIILKNGIENTAKISALFCSGMKGIELQRTAIWPFMTETRGRKIMKDVENQALKYFYELKKAYSNLKE